MNFGQPKKFNIIELGPGDGEMTKVLINTFKKFPKFNTAVNIFLYEKSNFLKKIQIILKLNGFKILLKLKKVR